MNAAPRTHDEFERAVRARTKDLEDELEELRADRDRYRREARWRQSRERSRPAQPGFTVDVVITSQTSGNAMTIRVGAFTPETRIVSGRDTLNVVADRPATGRALAAVLRRFIEQVEAWR